MASNDESAEYWNGEAAPRWVRQQVAIDRMLVPVTEALLQAAAPTEGERALDVGCGCGTTTLLLGERVGPKGRVTGLDLSGPMLEHARARLGPAQAHVLFEQADVATVSLPQGAAELAISRFGVMFFVDPVEAFANLRRGLADRGRAVFATWGPAHDNPWTTVWFAALPEVERPAPPEPGEPGPFSLCDPERIGSILGEAGFTDVRCEGLATPLPLGPSAEAAVALFSDVGPLSSILAAAPEPERAGIRRRVIDYLDARWDELSRSQGSVWLVHARA